MMKLTFTLFLLCVGRFSSGADIPGQQPNIAIDTRGVIRMVYGNGEKIYCMTSSNNGIDFSKPVLVGEIKGMHLGHSRGPQIASSVNYSMITAIDKEGTIHSYSYNHLKKTWNKSDDVNDSKGSAVEGLMALTADRNDNFYATWLDIRLDKKNNIFLSSIAGKSSTWTRNLMVYKSPDEHVCECCKPNISFNNGKLVVGFRNWLMGSRDIYYAVSTDKGKSFSAAQKSGSGTWTLKACPMDGGGLVVSETGTIGTAWRRNDGVYYSPDGKSEQKVGNGRDVSMAQYKSIAIVSWQEKSTIKVLDIYKKSTFEIGQGMSPRVYILHNRKPLCVWEDDKTIRYRII